MTNLEVINKLAYKVYRKRGSDYEPTSYIIKELLNCESSCKQIKLWMSCDGERYLNFCEPFIKPFLVNLLKQEFINFLQKLDCLHTFQSLTIEETSNQWRNDYMGITFFFNSLEEYLTYVSPFKYVRHAWCWHNTNLINGIELEKLWLEKLAKILLKNVKI